VSPRLFPFAHTGRIEAAGPKREDGAGAPPRREAAQEMMIGQGRAIEAIDFGVRMRGRGFNIYVLGESGTGKSTTVERIVEAQASRQPVGRDLVYLYDFDRPDNPRGAWIPAGTADLFAKDVEDAVDDLSREIPRVLATAAFRDRRNAILDQSQSKLDQRFARLSRYGRRFGLLVRREADRLVIAPMRRGQPLTAEEYDALPEEERDAFEARSATFQRRIPEFERQVRKIQKGIDAELLRLERDAIQPVVEVVFEELLGRHGEIGRAIGRFLDQFRAHVLDNHRLFLPPDERAAPADAPADAPAPEAPPSADHVPYRVNVLVDRRRESRAPVVVERNPTYPNLFGYMEYRETHGVFSTDHTLIRPGALHRANGGYLILQAADLLRSPWAWDGLKRALRHQELRIEEIEEENRPKTTGSVRPTPVPLEVKVVLVGSAENYYALQSQDDDFTRLFKVKADFEGTMPLSRRTALAMGRFLGRVAQEEGLLPLDRAALARVLEHGVREASDQDRLSTRLATLIDLVAEADHWTRVAGRRTIAVADVGRALAERSRRHAKDEDGVLMDVRDGTLLIATAGEAVGQINGLTVYDQGDHSFGVPIRITARTYAGRKGVVNIDREVRLSGALHDKGALILVGFLGGRFAQDKPLSLAASITFEQNYGLIEGDSASAAELFALISSLAEVPVRQGIAVTGSVNQQGEVQPVGAVNEKVEGFFKVCRSRGLTGRQGVVIPRLNVRNLMIGEDVVRAVRAGRFHLWAIDHVDEGIEILTGLKAGRHGRGGWPPGTVNDLADRRLRTLAAVLREAREPLEDP
jgi:predicted ATP-dependent protease